MFSLFFVKSEDVVQTDNQIGNYFIEKIVWLGNSSSITVP